MYSENGRICLVESSDEKILGWTEENESKCYEY